MGGARSTHFVGSLWIFRRRIWITLLVGLLTLLSSVPALAADAPELELYQALAYEDVNHTGDAVILMRYELDETGWTPYLNDATQETSLQIGQAYVKMYSGNMAQVEFQQHPPRIGHGLAGFYIPSDAPDFSTDQISVCVESDSIVFTNPTQACIDIYSASGGQAAFADQLVQTLLDLQLARTKQTGTYVNSDGLITQPGRTFAIEAIPIAPDLAWDAFQAGSTNIPLDPELNPTPSLNDTLDSGGAALVADLEIISNGYFGGVPGSTLLLWGLVAAGLLIGGAGFYYTEGNVSVAGIGFAMPLLFGIWYQAPTFAMYASMLFVLLMAGGVFFVRKWGS